MSNKMDILDHKEPITKIYFVRHGQTKANKYRLLFGKLDWDLNKKGVKQAKKVANRLIRIRAGVNPAPIFHYIISSPLERAKHTAEIISKKIKIPRIIVDKDLIEKSEGTWEGKSFWEVRSEDPKGYYKWVRDPFKNKPPGGESVLDLTKRVKRFYKTVLKKYLGKNIIVVAHSGPIRLFILSLLKASIDKFWYLKIECGSITEVHVSKKHAVIWSVNER